MPVLQGMEQAYAKAPHTNVDLFVLHLPSVRRFQLVSTCPQWRKSNTGGWKEVLAMTYTLCSDKIHEQFIGVKTQAVAHRYVFRAQTTMLSSPSMCAIVLTSAVPVLCGTVVARTDCGRWRGTALSIRVVDPALLSQCSSRHNDSTKRTADNEHQDSGVHSQRGLMTISASEAEHALSIVASKVKMCSWPIRPV